MGFRVGGSVDWEQEGEAGSGTFFGGGGGIELERFGAFVAFGGLVTGFGR